MGAFVFLSLAIPFTLESKLVNAPNSMTYQDYLKTDYWKAVSDAVKKRADYRCQLCNSQHDLCAHHRTYDHRGQELDHLSDLTCLCRRCHEIFHGVTATTKPKKSVEQKIYIDSYNMPDGERFTLTSKLIQACETKSGGFTSATINAFGVNSFVSGWKRKLIGTTISKSAYMRAVEGKFIFRTKKDRTTNQTTESKTI